MDDRPDWSARATQQLVRYEALFQLLDDIQPLEDLQEIARRVARQWKYFANVASWRLVVAKDDRHVVIDGARGEATLEEAAALSPWDAAHWQALRPMRFDVAADGPPAGLPPHLGGRNVSEVQVLPLVHGGQCRGVLTVSARHQPLGDLDDKFIRLFGNHFADRVAHAQLRQRFIDTLVQQATHDALTGALNRGTVLDRLRGQADLSARTGLPLSVVIADLDHFKAVNDTWGHAAGDTVLREAARRLLEATRDAESFGRYGGEEFLFILYPCPADAAATAAERFRQALAGRPVAFNPVTGQSVPVTASFGTASTEGRAPVDLATLLDRADVALYRAKAGGRNRVAAG